MRGLMADAHRPADEPLPAEDRLAEVEVGQVRSALVGIVQEVKRLVKIPVAVKLSPFFTAIGNVAHRLDEAGADGLVLFNRFYQPDIDIRTMRATPQVELSTSAELLLRLRWVAILHGRVKPSLAVTGGVATPADLGLAPAWPGLRVNHAAWSRGLAGVEQGQFVGRDERGRQPEDQTRPRSLRACALHPNAPQLDEVIGPG